MPISFAMRDTDSMTTVLVLGVALGIALLLTLPTLTALGARRRGSGPAGAVVSGVFFPITWTVWYLRDGRPNQRALHARDRIAATRALRHQL